MRTFLAIIVLALLTGCAASTSLTNKNVAHVYKRTNAQLTPEFVAFNESDSVTQLYFKVRTGELLYAKNSNGPNMVAKLRLTYRVYQSYESSVIVDSASVILFDDEPNSNTELIGDLRMKVPAKHDYVVEIITQDMIRKVEDAQYMTLRKSDESGRQNFLVMNESTGLPLFRYFIYPHERVVVKHNNASVTTLYGRYYDRTFPLAAPPFSMYSITPFEYQADSTFELDAMNGVFPVEVQSHGFYHFLTDPGDKAGFTLFQFGEYFPNLKQLDELIEPLRFITSKKEYNSLKESANTKEALDDFWLDNAVNSDRAKELIKHYYSRVESANRYFSSYTEGWQTDRGMIYLIFGPPNIIYRSSGAETWIYGEENNFMSLNFSFIKVKNPFTENDYLLNRSPVYKSNWYRAVDSWRQGRVYTN